MSQNNIFFTNNSKEYPMLYITISMTISVLFFLIVILELIGEFFLKNQNSGSLLMVVGFSLIGSLIAYSIVKSLSPSIAKSEGLVNYIVPNILFTIMAIPLLLTYIPYSAKPIFESLQLLYLGIPTLSIIYGYKYITVLLSNEIKKDTNKYLLFFKGFIGTVNIHIIGLYAFPIYTDLLGENAFMNTFLSSKLNFIVINILNIVFVMLIPILILTYNTLRIFLLQGIIQQKEKVSE